MELGTQRCHVHVTLLPTPMHPEWPLLDVEIRGNQLADTWEAVALQALTQFCDQHPMEITNLLISLFPATKKHDLAWLDRVDHMDILGYTCPQETILTSMRCMNALFRLYQLQKESMDLLLQTAQASHLTVNARNEQIDELKQGMDKRGAMVEQLEEQIQDLHMELDAAHAHIDWHHDHDAQHGAPDEMEVDGEPEEMEEVSDLDHEDGVVVPRPRSEKTTRKWAATRR